MIYHDNTFEALATAPVKQTRVEVVSQTHDPYGWYDGAINWNADTAADVLMSVTIDAVGNFLGTATKKATVKLLGIVNGAELGDTFQIRLGLYDTNLHSFNHISQGFYVIDTVAFDYEAGSTTVTMYDWMWKASQTPYTALTYPATVEGLAVQVAAALGIDLMTDFSALPNAGYSITEDLYLNIANATLQTVIQEIAASTGTTARISDTALVFSQFTVSSENLTSASLKKLKIGDTYGPVTSVILGRVPQNDNIVITNDVASSNIITNIDATTNLFTIVGNGMSDGTLVRLQSTATLPAPIQTNTNYFVFADTQTDTFALTPTYADAIAGTNIIDLTTVGSGSITLSTLVGQEIQINNVEILDDEREALLPALYSSLLGVGWNKSEAETVGLAWHEVGDVISYTQGATQVQSFISEVHVTLDGAVKESLVSVIPANETINYQTAGGVLKTIYNTEIKVDKQNNDITSVVSQQQQYQDYVDENFTKIYQDIDSIDISVQDGGGVNQIKNSVGYSADTNGLLNFWEYEGLDPLITNLAIDPEISLDGANDTGGWVMDVGSTRTRNMLGYVSAPSSLMITSNVSATGGVYGKTTKKFSGLVIGETYQFSAYLRVSNVKTYTISVDTSTPTTTSVSLTSTFTRYNLSFVATSDIHNISIYTTVGGTTFRNLSVDNVMLTQGSTLYDWFSGNTPNTSTDTYSWLGAANVSVSTWQHHPSVSESSDTGSLVAGALSGSRIDFTNGPGSIKQRVTVKPGAPLNLTLYAKKETQGIAKVTLSNDVDTYTVQLDDNTSYDWTRFAIQDVMPSSSYLNVTVEIDGDVSLFSITDLMLSKGAVGQPWEQAAGEVANTNVTFDTTGITVKSNVYDGAFTRITPLEFAGYDDKSQLAFALNNDTTIVNKMSIGGDVETKTHTIVFLTSGPNAGINFVAKG